MSSTKEEILQLLLPSCWRAEVLQMLHDDPVSGHFGVKRTLARIAFRFYWVGVKNDVADWCRQCDVCNARKGPSKHPRGPMKQYLVGAPLERVAIDILGPLPKTEDGNKYILVLTDYFTRWAEAYPLPNQATEEVAKVFMNQFIARFGVPRQLYTDKGTQFESKLFHELAKRLGIDKTRTTAMHPQSDGMVERLNRTIEETLSKFVARHQRDWDKHVYFVLMAYRSSVHESTGFSPSLLMLGREIELPVDLLFGPNPNSKSYEENKEGNYLEDLTATLWDVHAIARDKMRDASDRQKKQYDHKIFARQYSVGDAVWVFNPSKTKGRSPKLQCHWLGPYRITEVYTDLVYKIKRSPDSKETIIHHDRLKPYHGNECYWTPRTPTCLTGTLDTLPEKEVDGEAEVKRQPRKPTYLADYLTD